MHADNHIRKNRNVAELKVEDAARIQLTSQNVLLSARVHVRLGVAASTSDR